MNPVVVGKIATHTTHIVAILVTHTQVDIGNHTLVHTFLYTEVEHGLFLSIIDTSHLGEIALLVVCLDLIYDAGRQVFSGLSWYRPS